MTNKFHIIKDQPVKMGNKFQWAVEVHHPEYPGWAVQVLDNTSPERCRDKAQLICDSLNNEWNEYHPGDDEQLKQDK